MNANRDEISLGMDQIGIIWVERTQTRKEAEEAARTWQRKTMDYRKKTRWFSGSFMSILKELLMFKKNVFGSFLKYLEL